ncbi:MAG: hypothetical protein MHM6MM_001081 [Cercozoa sp. M6MM]
MPVVKLVLPSGEIRRVPLVEESEGAGDVRMDKLRQEVELIVGSASYKLEYTDDENDVVTLGSAPGDLNDALAVAASTERVLRLTVVVSASAPPVPPVLPEPPVPAALGQDSANNNARADNGVAVFGWPVTRTVPAGPGAAQQPSVRKVKKK